MGLTNVTLLTPPEPIETLRRFYARCRSPGFWGPVKSAMAADGERESDEWRGVGLDAALGIVACLGLVLATNVLFVADWWRVGWSLALCGATGGWLVRQMR